MPTEVYEDGIDLSIGLLESLPMSPDAPNPAYPLPQLRSANDEEVRTFRCVVLENPFVRAVLLPGLGGRLISLQDRRTDVEILRRHPSIEPQAGGLRGIFLREGIQLRLNGEDRLNALGNVATALDQPEGEEDEAGVWIAETSQAPGLGFHMRISLTPDRAELRFEVRAHNRTLRPLPYDGELSIYLGAGEMVGSAFYSSERDAGLMVVEEDAPLDGLRLEDGVLRVSRFGAPRELAPRQVDAWSVRLVPLSRLGGLTGASSEGGIHLEPTRVRVQAAERRTGHKLLLLTEDGQTLEAPVELHPETVTDIPLEGLPSAPTAVLLQDPGKEELIRADTRFVAPPPLPAPVHVTPPTLDPELNEVGLRRATADVATRHLAYTRLAQLLMERGEYAAAGERLETALMFNADDPLLWWAKAVAARMAGDEGEERPELLNAHYLAPLEPALRAEGFLSQPMEMGKEPSPLVSALEENPEEFVEVACLLIEHGLLDQASRWIDEAVRHRDLAMLRYLQADCLLRGTRMVAEAAEHIAAAGRVAGPPYPWRAVERTALERLSARFPQDERIRQLLAMTPVVG